MDKASSHNENLSKTLSNGAKFLKMDGECSMFDEFLQISIISFQLDLNMIWATN